MAGSSWLSPVLSQALAPEKRVWDTSVHRQIPAPRPTQPNTVKWRWAHERRPGRSRCATSRLAQCETTGRPPAHPHQALISSPPGLLTLACVCLFVPQDTATLKSVLQHSNTVGVEWSWSNTVGVEWSWRDPRHTVRVSKAQTLT